MYIERKAIHRRMIIFGYGAVASTFCNIFTKKFKMDSYVLVDKRRIKDIELEIFGDIMVSRLEIDIEPKELFSKVLYFLQDNDIVCDFFGANETLEIIHACNQKKGILYLNASLEDDCNEPNPCQYNFYQILKEYSLKFKPKFTACIDCGANPGLITHFAILGLFSMAKNAIENKVYDADKIAELLEKKDIPSLAEILQVDVIHISEIENIEPNNQSQFQGYTTNSWCIPAFHQEWNERSEVSMGTHDKKDLTSEGYTKVPLSNPTFIRIPYPTYLRTASPTGIFTGKVVIHPETLEIATVFANENHCPTVAFVYHPSRLPRKDMEKENWQNLPTIVFTEANAGPLEGSETMGATLISSRDDIPPRWFGSVLSCEQERKIGTKNNPTTLQVAAGVIAHLLLALGENDKGICMPHDFDSQKIMKIAEPYLGTVVDTNLAFRLPTAWNELLSTKEELNDDF